MRVEQNIPIPPRGKGVAALVRSLDVGDSVYVADDRHANAIRIAGHRSGIRLATRKEGEGRRVWRIA